MTQWLGRVPGEAFSDSTQAALVRRYRHTIEELQASSVFTQENGHRRRVRWAELSGPRGTIRVRGTPTFDMTLRRWTRRPDPGPATPV